MQTFAPERPHSPEAPAACPVQVERVDRLAGLASIEAAWRALEGGAAAGPFAGYDWASVAGRHYATSRRLHVAVAWAEGEPTAILPLAYRRFLGIKTLALLGGGLADYSMADYQDVLLAPAHAEEALSALLDDLEMAPWDLLWLQEMPAESPAARRLPDLAREKGWRVAVRPASDVHRVELPASWEDYVAGLSSSWRKEIRSKLRRLESDHGATFTLVERDEDLDAAMETLFDLHTQRWNAVGEPGIFDTERSRSFYRELAHRMHAAGRLYLALLRTAQGEPIGAGFGFDQDGTRYAYTYGYKPGPEWEKASLGLMIDCLCIRDAIASGLRRVDLMRSEGEYKKRYGAVRADNFEVMVFRSRSAYLRVAAYRRLRAAAKRLLKRR